MWLDLEKNKLDLANIGFEWSCMSSQTCLYVQWYFQECCKVYGNLFKYWCIDTFESMVGTAFALQNKYNQCDYKWYLHNQKSSKLDQLKIEMLLDNGNLISVITCLLDLRIDLSKWFKKSLLWFYFCWEGWKYHLRWLHSPIFWLLILYHIIPISKTQNLDFSKS